MITPGEYLSFLDARLPGLVAGAHVYGSHVLDDVVAGSDLDVLWVGLGPARVVAHHLSASRVRAQRPRPGDRASREGVGRRRAAFLGGDALKIALPAGVLPAARALL